MDWFQIGKGVHQGCILSPCLFSLYAEYLIWDARLDQTQAGITFAGGNINNLRYADDTTLMAESNKEVKILLMKVKEGSEKAALKFTIQKGKIMATGPITSWQIDGKTMETVTVFIFWAPKSLQMKWFHATMKFKDACSLKEKLWQSRQYIKKQRHYFADKGLSINAMVFPVVIYGCETWTIKQAECWRIDAFELWCWRRLLRVPWTARRSNQWILKDISPEYSLEGLMLKLKL